MPRTCTPASSASPLKPPTSNRDAHDRAMRNQADSQIVIAAARERVRVAPREHPGDDQVALLGCDQLDRVADYLKDTHAMLNPPRRPFWWKPLTERPAPRLNKDGTPRKNARIIHHKFGNLNPGPPKLNKDGTPRKPYTTAAERLYKLRHSEERGDIVNKTVKERGAFAVVPSFLCTIALPATEPVAKDWDWELWADRHKQECPPPKITPQLIRKWRAWGLENGVVVPDWPANHQAAEWIAWCAGTKAPRGEPHITALTRARWKRWARENGVSFPTTSIYIRTSGKFRLEVLASPTYGCPYGIYPRRLIVGIASKVKSMQQNGEANTRTIELGKNYKDALRTILGANYNVGSTASIRFAEQFNSLLNSHILWWRDIDKRYTYQTYDFATCLARGEPVTGREKRHMLFEAKGLTLTLGERFHEDCLRAAPIDFAIFDKLADQGNCLAVDVYMWLTFRAWHLRQQHRVDMPPLSWPQLMEQFGGNYKALRVFRDKFIQALNLVRTLYPAMEWDETGDRGPGTTARVCILLREPSVGADAIGYKQQETAAQSTGTDGTSAVPAAEPENHPWQGSWADPRDFPPQQVPKSGTLPPPGKSSPKLPFPAQTTSKPDPKS